MRRAVAALIATLALVACGSTSPVASHTSPTPVASAASSVTPSASPSPTPFVDPATVPALTGTYGLLYSRTDPGLTYILHLVKADATLAASVSTHWPDLPISCGGNTDTVNIPRPVSASNSHVYFRDGSTIRMVVPPNTSVAVTAVPDSSKVVSVFSVRPDDQKIAVVVIDVSSPTTITTRLYVEDLVGGGHHADIYAASTTKSVTATTLWPMGWHQGNLVLAVAPACTTSLLLGPTEWHVSSPVTAKRVATIKSSGCQLSLWPSPVGVACAQGSGPTTLYDWGGTVLGVTGPGVSDLAVAGTGLSPAGQSIYFSGGSTRIVQLGPGPYATVEGTEVCGWIDEDHLLSTTSVVKFPAETPGNVQVTATATPLPQSAQPDPSTPQTSGCAGRFPGGL